MRQQRMPRRIDVTASRGSRASRRGRRRGRVRRGSPAVDAVADRRVARGRAPPAAAPSDGADPAARTGPAGARTNPPAVRRLPRLRPRGRAPGSPTLSAGWAAPTCAWGTPICRATAWATSRASPASCDPGRTGGAPSSDRLFVLNVPMLERNEEGVPDARGPRAAARAARRGTFDHHFRTLAERLVELGVPDTVLVLGWEMNGTTYTHRCGPDPEAWKKYWRRIVTTMRAVPGQKFRFDFAPSRGEDAIPWTAVLSGRRRRRHHRHGLLRPAAGRGLRRAGEASRTGCRHHVDFAAGARQADLVPGMGAVPQRRQPRVHAAHARAGSTSTSRSTTRITDYCPHGVWQCADNPKSVRGLTGPRSSAAPDQDPAADCRAARRVAPDRRPAPADAA